MPWYVYLLEFIAGAVFTNGIPHFVQGMCGNRFQSPFGSPPGVGESSPLSNVVWGYANLASGSALLWFFTPQGAHAACGWALVGLGSLLMAMFASHHFGKARAAIQPHDK